MATKKTTRKKRTSAKTVAKKAKPKKAGGKRTRAQLLASYDTHVKGRGLVEIMDLSLDESLQSVKGWISTQSLALDQLVAAPGLPRGRVVEIFGQEGTGKSTLSDHIMAACQQMGGLAHLIEPESAKDLAYSRRVGLSTDKDKFRWYQPKDNILEAVMAQVEDIVTYWGPHKEIPHVIVVDSIGATPCRAELEGDSMGVMQPGLAARTLHQAMRRMINKIAKSNILVVLLNQVYSKIGIAYGDPEKPYGGNALAFSASVRIKLARGKMIEYPTGHPIGTVIHAYCRKSKVSPATGNKVDFALIHNVGIDNSWTIYNDFVKLKWVQQGGGWNQLVIPGQAEPLRWQKRHIGLTELCQQDPELFPKLASMHQQWREGL